MKGIEELEIKCMMQGVTFRNCPKAIKCPTCNYFEVVRNTYADKIKAQLAEVRARDEVWRNKVSMLSNDLAKAWAERDRYRDALQEIVTIVVSKRHTSSELYDIARKALEG